MRPAIVVGVVRRISRPSAARIVAPPALACACWRPRCSRRACAPAPRRRAQAAPRPRRRRRRGARATRRRRHRRAPEFPAETTPPETPRPLREDAAPEPNVPSFEPGFGPRYHIEQIVVSGNRKTKTALILREIGLAPGDVVSASDQRVEAARFRLLSLGYFLDARLSLKRGKKRGGAVLLVEVEERGTIVVNELYPSTSAATTFWGGIDVSETNFLGRGINLGGAFVVSTTPKVPDVARRRRPAPARLAAGDPQPGREPVADRALQRRQRVLPRSSAPTPTPTPPTSSAVRTRRAGGILGAGKPLGRYLRLFADLREEAVNGQLPPTARPHLPDGRWSSRSTSTSTRATAASAR